MRARGVEHDERGLGGPEARGMPRAMLSLSPEWNCMRASKPTRRTLTEVTLFFCYIRFMQILEIAQYTIAEVGWNSLCITFFS